ncbi:MAG: CRISPR-associated endonuclease Cas2 [Candidatus Cryptobacteroides sp.]|jgi:CRISPR-associated protein Cas2
MMVLITYDVDTISETGKKRLRKVAKECQNYGRRVQNSVFECVIDEAKFVILRSKLNNIINKELDSLRFYFLGKNWDKRVVVIGKETSFDITGVLVI